MLMKELCSYPWVRDTYGDAPARRTRGCRCRASTPAARTSARRAPEMATAASTGAIDYEPAGELKIGQVGIANLRVRTLDVAQLADEMRDRVTRAPKLFARAAVVLDFGGLSTTPDVATARALLDALRDAGVLPVGAGLRHAATTKHWRAKLGLPLLAKFRAQYEPAAGAAPAAAATARATRRHRRAEAAPAKPAPAAPAEAGRRRTRPGPDRAGALGPAGLRARTAT